jgi:hypothetical protein
MREECDKSGWLHERDSPLVISEVKRQSDLLLRGDVHQCKHTKVELAGDKEMSHLHEPGHMVTGEGQEKD